MKKQFTIRLEPADIEMLEELAKKQAFDCTASSYARFIITEHLKSPTLTKEKVGNVEPEKTVLKKSPKK